MFLWIIDESNIQCHDGYKVVAKRKRKYVQKLPKLKGIIFGVVSLGKYATPI